MGTNVGYKKYIENHYILITLKWIVRDTFSLDDQNI